MDNMAAIDIKGLQKTYANGFEAVKGLDLVVNAGDFYALLGPNGAGKSTTIGMLTSLVRKTAGQIKIYGIDIDDNFNEAKKYLGLVPQEFNFNVFETVYHIVCTQAGFYNIPRHEANERALYYIEKLGLMDKRNEQARNLSGGMKRRLMIARAMAHEPKILILDEPTAGVDIEIRHDMWAFLQEINAAGTTIILTTHYLEEAEQLCRNVGIINEGKIVHQSSMKALLNELNEEIFILDIAPKKINCDKIPEFFIQQRDKATLEVVVPRGLGLNALFSALSAQGVTVLSLRNKVNRLEELFLRLVGGRRK